MTHAERIKLFEPHRELQRLNQIESDIIRTGMMLNAMQWESLKIQLERGIYYKRLALAKRITTRMANVLAMSMMDTATQSSINIYNEMQRARWIHDNPDLKDMMLFSAADFTPDVGLDWYEKYTLKLMDVHQKATLDATQQAIADGIKQGDTVKDMMKSLGRIHEDFGRNRLEKIARTETAKIYGQARWQEMSSDEDVVGYEISAVMDSRVCPICEARNGKFVKIGKAEGNYPPFHILCRCMVLPVWTWDVADNPDAFTEISSTAPDVPDGFGTTTMTIPSTKRNRITAKLTIKQSNSSP